MSKQNRPPMVGRFNSGNPPFKPDRPADAFGGPPMGANPSEEDLAFHATLGGSPVNTDDGDLGPAPVIAEADILDTAEADVVIVGCGHGGAQCMLAAAEGGLSVITLERKPEGRLRFLGEQIGTFNSRFFIQQGLGPYNLDEIVQEFMASGAYLVNQDVINAYVKHSGEMLDHMIYDVVGIEDELMRPDQWNIHQAFGMPRSYPLSNGGVKSWAGTLELRGSWWDPPAPAPGGHPFIGAASRMTDFEMRAVRRAEALGARLDYDRRGTVLTLGGGRVTGVIARDSGGQYHRYLARRGVVLATGHSAGGGQKLGRWAGGKIENTPSYAATSGDIANPFGYCSFLLLNKHGERFVNESNPYALGYACFRQPTGYICAVSDAKWERQIATSGLQHRNSDFGIPVFLEQVRADMENAARSPEQPVPVRSMSASERQLAPVYAAQSLEKLADILGFEGADRARWFESIARYNQLCREGADADYGKDARTLIPIDTPPFYGFAGMTGSISDAPPRGFMVNRHFQVLDSGHEPIPGLFASGICVGGRHAIFYPTPCGGNYIGMSMTHGRVLGKYLSTSRR